MCIELAASLGKTDVTQSPRLQQARQLFEEGKFEEANAALNETDIFEARKNLREQLENLAEELLLKAQLTALNKTLPNWFEEAKRFYEESGKHLPEQQHLFLLCLLFTSPQPTRPSHQILPTSPWFCKRRSRKGYYAEQFGGFTQ